MAARVGVGPKLWRLGVAAGALLGWLACGGGLPVEGTLRINLQTEPPTLDWTRATDGVSITVIEQLMRGLTRLGPDLRPAPALAERWDLSPDGRTYTFHLRRDVRWTDGVPLRAEQFVYSWRRLLDPATAAEYAYFLFPVRGARAFNAGEQTDPSRVGVRALGPHTLEVELEAPLVYFPSITTFMVTFPGREDLVEQYGDSWTEPGAIQTLGPFLLQEWQHEYRIVLVANPGFYGAPPLPLRRSARVPESSGAARLLLRVQRPRAAVRRCPGAPRLLAGDRPQRLPEAAQGGGDPRELLDSPGDAAPQRDARSRLRSRGGAPAARASRCRPAPARADPGRVQHARDAQAGG
jgi:hypothetical protein